MAAAKTISPAIASTQTNAEAAALERLAVSASPSKTKRLTNASPAVASADDPTTRCSTVDPQQTTNGAHYETASPRVVAASTHEYRSSEKTRTRTKSTTPATP